MIYKVGAILFCFTLLTVIAPRTPTLQTLTERIIECEKGEDVSKLGFAPIPANYAQLHNIQEKFNPFSSIDKRLANMQLELGFIREELRKLRK